MAELSDQSLMVLYQRGDERAFNELYHRYNRRVFGYLCKRLEEREKIEEIFQGTWMKVHRSRHQYNSNYRFTPWLFTICRSVLIDKIRKLEKRDEILLEAVEDKTCAPVELESKNLDLNELSGQHREIIEMRYVKDMTFDEISKYLEIPAQTARKRMSRALQKLRVLWTNRAKEHAS